MANVANEAANKANEVKEAEADKANEAVDSDDDTGANKTMRSRMPIRPTRQLSLKCSMRPL